MGTLGEEGGSGGERAREREREREPFYNFRHACNQHIATASMVHINATQAKPSQPTDSINANVSYVRTPSSRGPELLARDLRLRTNDT